MDGQGCSSDKDGYFNGSANPGQADVPDAPGATGTNGNVAPAIIALSNRLSQYINDTCYLDCSLRCNAYKDSLELSNPDFIALANYFKNTNSNTLREAINSTWYGCDNFLGQDPKVGMLLRPVSYTHLTLPTILLV